MSDQEPTLRLNLGEDREFEMRPTNATLFTFLGKTAMHGIMFDNSNVDHVFLQTGNEDERTMTGTYLFKTSGSYEAIAAFMIENQYPLILNRRDVPGCDMNAYLRMVDQHAASEAEELDDFFPEDWK